MFFFQQPTFFLQIGKQRMQQKQQGQFQYHQEPTPVVRRDFRCLNFLRTNACPNRLQCFFGHEDLLEMFDVPPKFKTTPCRHSQCPGISCSFMHAGDYLETTSEGYVMLLNSSFRIPICFFKIQRCPKETLRMIRYNYISPATPPLELLLSRELIAHYQDNRGSMQCILDRWRIASFLGVDTSQTLLPLILKSGKEVSTRWLEFPLGYASVGLLTEIQESKEHRSQLAWVIDFICVAQNLMFRTKTEFFLEALKKASESQLFVLKHPQCKQLFKKMCYGKYRQPMFRKQRENTRRTPCTPSSTSSTSSTSASSTSASSTSTSSTSTSSTSTSSTNAAVVQAANARPEGVKDRDISSLFYRIPAEVIPSDSFDDDETEEEEGKSPKPVTKPVAKTLTQPSITMTFDLASPDYQKTINDVVQQAKKYGQTCFCTNTSKDTVHVPEQLRADDKIYDFREQQKADKN